MRIFFYLLALYLGPNPACAQITGVTELLSRGPGAEASALGSSIVATIQDPTALYWNPAGLAAAGGAVSGEHLFLYDGTRYDFIGLSVPSRFGTFGIGALQLYRGGIIARAAIDDPGNQVSNSQTDYLLGFARNLGEHWSAGSTVDVLNYNLAGYGDTSVGLDLGGRSAYPGGDIFGLRQTLWSFGVVVKNLIQPRLKLLNDAEIFPTELRGGLGFSFNMFSRASLASGLIRHDRGTISLSLRKALGEPGFHPSAGLSYSFQNILILRAGYDGGVSGGIGLRTADGKFSLDYSLENKPLSNNHRFTLSYRFSGPKIPPQISPEGEPDDEYLKASNRAQALAGEYFSKGQALFKDAKYDDAVDPLQTAAILDPDDQEKVNTYRRTVEVRRRQTIRDLSGKLEAALGHGQYVDAYRLIADLLDLKSDNRTELIGILRRLPGHMHATEYAQISKSVFDDKSKAALRLNSVGLVSDALHVVSDLEILQSTSTTASTAQLKTQIVKAGDALRQRLEGLIQKERPSSGGRALRAALALKRAYPDDADVGSILDSNHQEYLSRLSLAPGQRLYLRKLYYLAAIDYAKKDTEEAAGFLEEILRQNADDSNANALRELMIWKGNIREDMPENGR